ncbi:hypothetical protein [Eilatimonas milleporae]|uniref:PD-(D/E)XK nuclease superfamily protein n=1 Tax=Eilatimonas milleporae TaxID=911205 RepID=A0A3M0CT09_9PROT|nr:hypothetical protein [Eilatimonas milleporae]RMB12664.1 hypothetical protein BXY39_0087 [Eilatimonas milleporae]
MQRAITGLELIQGETARLIPVASEKALEGRATSILLATLAVVENFAAAILRTVGQRVGSRASIQCFTEVVLSQDGDQKDRPDGLIVVTVGKRTWSALIESKIGNAVIDAEQIQRYLALARQHKIDAVITISNQFAALPTHHPIKVPKTATRTVKLFHWSWTSLLTQAVYQIDVEQDIDPEQRYILQEFCRYFSHASSGVKTFDAMNKEWREVCLTVKNGGKLLKASNEVKNTVGAWNQEQRDIALLLTRELKAPVSVKLRKSHRDDPEQRLKDDCADLVKTNCLSSIFVIPDAASDLTVTANLGLRTITCMMELQAPADKKSTKARVNWLLRQLQRSSDGTIQVVAKWPGRMHDTATSLEVLRVDLNALQCENQRLAPSRFQVVLVRDLAGKFSGAKTFLDGMNLAITDFYRAAGEHLKPWTPTAPKMPVKDDNVEEFKPSEVNT